MFKHILRLAIALVITLLSSNQLRAEDESSRFKKLSDAFFNDIQRSNPEFATFLGLTDKYNCNWTDFSEAGFRSRYSNVKKYLNKLQKLKRENLSLEDRISYDVFIRILNETIEEYDLNIRYMPLNQLSGAPLDVDLVFSMMPKKTLEDYKNIVQRLDGISQLIDEYLALLKKGLELGITPPKVSLQSLPKSIENFISKDIKESVFFTHFDDVSNRLSQKDANFVVGQALTIIENKINPAYEKLLEYICKTYLPKCREEIGACTLPNGQKLYEYCIKLQTTTSLTATEIHALGLKEVARIQDEMETIIKDLGFQGSILDFFHYLNTFPDFFYDDPNSLLADYRRITRFIDSQLPTLFGHLPKLGYEVVPVPAHLEQSQVSAYYLAGSLKMGRLGRFYVNTYDLTTRPKWQMESLALHEAVPGHHFQISIAQENVNLPEFRKYLGYTSYIEGWALYAESLGGELGLYESPFSKFGRLIEEIWRATRLVVDTGMHAFGWSREKAIEYMIKTTGVSEREVATEIDRYLVWPGQALAYKIGELTIQNWRERAKEALGDQFDIRDFHDVLLQQGALPLDICEEQINLWININSKDFT